MYGEHSFEKARQIADQKTAETGQQHIVVPCEGENSHLFTVGVPIKAVTADELLARFQKKFGRDPR